MSDVEKAREQKLPHCVDSVTCARCGTLWIAVHPECERVECPKCGLMNRPTDTWGNVEP